MNVLIINASPKKKGGASRTFSSQLKLMLAGCKVTTCDVCTRGNYENALGLLPAADAVVISVPLYVDGIPSHLLPFLVEAEQLCIKNKLQFKLYVISNNGFIEGVQNKLHLNMYEAWCKRAGIEWGGGFGIGGGVMLYVLSILFFVFAGLDILKTAIGFIQSGVLTGAQIWSNFQGLVWILFFMLGGLVCEALLAHAIRNKKSIKNMYTRAMLPSFIFLVVASLFMTLGALFKGTLPHKLFKRFDLNGESKTLPKEA